MQNRLKHIIIKDKIPLNMYVLLFFIKTFEFKSKLFIELCCYRKLIYFKIIKV